MFVLGGVISTCFLCRPHFSKWPPNFFESSIEYFPNNFRVDLSVTKFKVQGAMLGPNQKIKIFTKEEGVNKALLRETNG